jgi:anti-anti-sigma regulatory factor
MATAGDVTRTPIGDDAVVVRFLGEVAPCDPRDLRSELTAALQNGRTCLVVDLDRVSELNPRTVRTIRAAAIRARRAHGAVAVVSPHEELRRIVVARTEGLVVVADSVAAALARIGDAVSGGLAALPERLQVCVP